MYIRNDNIIFGHEIISKIEANTQVLEYIDSVVLIEELVGVH